ncbi:uncharacterized protein LOC110429140 [Herrania umbratica]|uniref:Uncharacterized protein LOC110429140 n=1 Tax=Herrania umbratica TaxID=108875 RepID=A0A6J1BNV2_9ROSI|nr:uncharacterized protein LOC110429140 [Herrania umbratica]
MEFVVRFFDIGSHGNRVNQSFVTFIPKVGNSSKLKDYKPISLVGSLYKIVAKLQANRLKKVIGEVIGNNQFVFTKRRQLMDNDTMVFSYLDLEEIKNIRRILRIFRAMSRLKINFAKRGLIRIDIEIETLEEWAVAMGCRSDKLSNTYLSFPLEQGTHHSL